MKGIKTASALAVTMLMLASCSNDNAVSEPSASVAAESTVSAVTQISETPQETYETLQETVTENIQPVSYKYQPAEEISNAHFYSDDIETEMIWTDIFSQDTPPEKSDYAQIDTISHELIKDILEYSFENTEYTANNIYGYHLSYMLYDMNNDGTDDYLLKTTFKCIWDECFYKIYLAQSDGTFTPVTWDCVEIFHDPYILKTETNGLKDIMVLHNSNYPIITYNGSDSYTPCEMLDERHTFMEAEIMPDNILHINMKVSVADTPDGEYYTAIKLADNPYLAENMLYSCYLDGTPETHTEAHDHHPGKFNPSSDGYDFYASLTDEGSAAFSDEDNVWSLLDLLEIKHIAANV